MHIGGVQSFIVNYAPYLQRNGIRLNIAVQTSEDELYDAYLKEIGCRIFHITSLGDSKIRFIQDLYKLLKSHPEIKIVHAHQNFANIYPLITARFCGVKVRISHSHSTDTITKQPFLKALAKKMLQYLLPLYATDYFACSSMAATWLFGKYCHRDRCKIIRNAIDTTKYQYNTEVRKRIRGDLRASDKTIWLQVGSLNTNKNQIFTLNLFSEYLKINPNALLLICGDGAILPQLIDVTKQLHIQDNVLFLGNVQNVHELLSVADIYFMPSFFEGLPLSIVEAQAAGISCIVSQAIPNEVIFADNVIKVNSFKLEEWLEVCLKRQSNNDRILGKDIVKKHGYDISKEGIEMARMYKYLVSRV